MAETYLIEIREGSGEPGFIELRPGVELAPLGVGTEGAWRVRGAGVLGVHLYLYFDGQALFAQSADQTKPAVVNGRTVGATWTPLTAPATIALGTARLFFRPNASSPRISEPDSDRTIAQAPPSDAIDDAPSDEDRTIAVAPPVRTAAPERPFQPGAFASRSDESTRFAPIGDDGPDSEATRVVPLVEAAPGGETPELGTPAIRAMGPAAQRPGGPVRPAAGVPWSVPDAPPGPTPAPPHGQRSTSPDLQRQQAAGDHGQNATLYEPLEARPTEGQEPAGPFPRPPPGFGPPSEAAPPTPLGPPPGLLNVPPPAPPAPGAKPEGSRLAREWKAAPPVRKILYVLLLPALGGAFWVIFSGTEPPPAKPKPKPASADAAPSSSSASPPASSSAPTGPTPPPPAASSNSPEQTPPSTPTPPPNGPAQPNPPPSAQPQPSHHPPDVPAAPVAEAGADADRRERTAADFVATGQYEQAAQIYDQLALAQRNEPHPNPAFAEAARILRIKLDAGIR